MPLVRQHLGGILILRAWGGKEEKQETKWGYKTQIHSLQCSTAVFAGCLCISLFSVSSALSCKKFFLLWKLNERFLSAILRPKVRSAHKKISMKTHYPERIYMTQWLYTATSFHILVTSGLQEVNFIFFLLSEPLVLIIECRKAWHLRTC